MLAQSLSTCRVCKPQLLTSVRRLQHRSLGIVMASKLYPPLSIEGWTVLITGESRCCKQTLGSVNIA